MSLRGGPFLSDEAVCPGVLRPRSAFVRKLCRIEVLIASSLPHKERAGDRSSHIAPKPFAIHDDRKLSFFQNEAS